MFVCSSRGYLFKKCFELDAVPFSSFILQLGAGGSGADRPAYRTERRYSSSLQLSQDHQIGRYYLRRSKIHNQQPIFPYISRLDNLVLHEGLVLGSTYA